MAVHHFKLDLLKNDSLPVGTMVARVGDSGEVVEVEVTRAGVAVTGFEASLMACKPDRTYVDQAMTVSGSTASVTVNQAVFGLPGSMDNVYVKVTTASGDETTGSIITTVLPSASFSGHVSGSYSDSINELMTSMQKQLEACEEAAIAANEAANNVKSQVSKAESAATAASKSASNAEASAKRATKISSGTGAPTASANSGDQYVDVATGDWYSYS